LSCGSGRGIAVPLSRRRIAVSLSCGSGRRIAVPLSRRRIAGTPRWGITARTRLLRILLATPV